MGQESEFRTDLSRQQWRRFLSELRRRRRDETSGARREELCLHASRAAGSFDTKCHCGGTANSEWRHRAVMTQGRRFEHRWPGILLLVMACLATALVGCDFGLHRGVRLFLEEPFPKKLSAWHLFAAAAKQGQLTPNPVVLPYDLNTPLFSDYADKYRFVWMPPGSSAEYKDDAAFEFPIGTIFAKSFAFP